MPCKIINSILTFTNIFQLHNLRFSKHPTFPITYFAICSKHPTFSNYIWCDLFQAPGTYSLSSTSETISQYLGSLASIEAYYVGPCALDTSVARCGRLTKYKKQSENQECVTLHGQTLENHEGRAPWHSTLHPSSRP